MDETLMLFCSNVTPLAFFQTTLPGMHSWFKTEFTCKVAFIADLIPDMKASAVLKCASSPQDSEPESRTGTPPT